MPSAARYSLKFACHFLSVVSVTRLLDMLIDSAFQKTDKHHHHHPFLNCLETPFCQRYYPGFKQEIFLCDRYCGMAHFSLHRVCFILLITTV